MRSAPEDEANNTSDTSETASDPGGRANDPTHANDAPEPDLTVSVLPPTPPQVHELHKPEPKRTPARKKAQQLARQLRGERPDYAYLKAVFRHLREELEVECPRSPKRLPYVPSEEELRRYYQTVWQTRNFGHLVLIKTLFYTGVRVGELVSIRLAEVDLDRCQIRITEGKGGKDRVVPFPDPFKETLALHMARMREKGATYLFESSWKKRYSERGARRMLERYARAAGLERTVSPHQLRHFLLTWLKKQGIDDALLQPYSGHASRKSLEVYSRLAIGEAQAEYNRVIGRFPI
jgi:integrase/recombinase XerD